MSMVAILKKTVRFSGDSSLTLSNYDYRRCMWLMRYHHSIY